RHSRDHRDRNARHDAALSDRVASEPGRCRGGAAGWSAVPRDAEDCERGQVLGAVAVSDHRAAVKLDLVVRSNTRALAAMRWGLFLRDRVKQGVAPQRTPDGPGSPTNPMLNPVLASSLRIGLDTLRIN